MQFQLNNCRRGIEELRRGLNELKPIVYSDNGYRPVSATDFLPRALEAGKKIGITRLGSIAGLINTDYPVVQSTRPHIYDHINVGINTGSQGKGPTLEQATVSCLMESLESYAMETRGANLIRASFDELSKSHVVVDPRFCIHSFNAKTCTKDEPILWEESYCHDLDCKVFVPAELIYFPLKAKSHGTQPHFRSGYNGMAAGVTYLDATIHALYELIERRYWASVEAGEARFYEVAPSEHTKLQKLVDALKDNFEVRLFLVQVKSLPNIPCFQAQLVGPLGGHRGMGCCFDFEIAMERALSEAVQCMATSSSSSREDIVFRSRVRASYSERVKASRAFSEYSKHEGNEHHKKLPFRISFIPAGRVPLKEISGHQVPESLNHEYKILREWLEKANFGPCLIANMTSTGIDIPVVRVVVPGMHPSAQFLEPHQSSQENIDRWRYRTIVQKKMQEFYQTISRPQKPQG